MKTFIELELSTPLLQAIEELGFLEPMPVQEQVIPLMLNNAQDIIALAQTGSGKTAAFGLPLIQETDLSKNKTQALILCPTRELCLQISNALTDYSMYIPDLHIVPVYGGTSINEQIKLLQKGAHIIVATPGRLIDLIERKAVKLQNVKRVILDEADEMLNMGFVESIDNILASLPENHTTLLFSATMPSEIARLTKTYMMEPLEITIGEKNTGAENVKHVYYSIAGRDKYLALKRIADFYPDIYGIVFCRTRKDTQNIADKLIQDGYNAEALHGDLSQNQREYIMQKFRIRNIQLLVATDVAARGIDVQDLTHVINFDLPEEKDVYIHRSGRTGRAGKAGVSISLVSPKEQRLLKDTEKRVGKSFIQTRIPGGKEVCEKQLFHLINKIETVEINETEIAPFLPVLYKKLDWFEKEELIKRLVSVEFNRFLEYYKEAVDLNQGNGDKKRKERTERSSSAPSDGRFTKLYLNIGKMDGLSPSDLMEMINEQVPETKFDIGEISIQKKFTVFEIENKGVQKLLSAFEDTYIDERPLVLKLDGDQPSDGKKRTGGKKGGDYHSKRDDSRRRDGGHRDSGHRDRGNKGGGRKDGGHSHRDSRKSDSYSSGKRRKDR
ncbi:MAG: DEAD/DEAH box helicase [Ignavibacteria bacterium]|nr:DEAD/DEAH box helicase [Ignavibacteria bacterium]